MKYLELNWASVATASSHFWLMINTECEVEYNILRTYIRVLCNMIGFTAWCENGWFEELVIQFWVRILSSYYLVWIMLDKIVSASLYSSTCHWWWTLCMRLYNILHELSQFLISNASYVLWLILFLYIMITFTAKYTNW